MLHIETSQENAELRAEIAQLREGRKSVQPNGEHFVNITCQIGQCRVCATDDSLLDVRRRRWDSDVDSSPRMRLNPSAHDWQRPPKD